MGMSQQSACGSWPSYRPYFRSYNSCFLYIVLVLRVIGYDQKAKGQCSETAYSRPLLLSVTSVESVEESDEKMLPCTDSLVFTL